MDNEHSVQQVIRTGSGPHRVEITPPTAQTSAHAALRQETTCGVESDVGLVIFEILVAAMWSDGELVKEEVERGRAAAEQLRVRPRGGGAFAAIAEGALPFSELDFAQLNPGECRLAYAAAEWVAGVNEEPSTRRSGFLRALATRMRVHDAEVQRLREVVATVEATHESDSVAFLDLLAHLLPANTATVC
jgi:hypothetical protein